MHYHDYYRQTNHWLHAVLTLLSCGCWAPIWLAVWVWNSIPIRRDITRYR